MLRLLHFLKAKALGLGGDMKGDGYQNGGALVVEVGGSKTLLHYVQKEAPDHVSNADVLKVNLAFRLLNLFTLVAHIISADRNVVTMWLSRLHKNVSLNVLILYLDSFLEINN